MFALRTIARRTQIACFYFRDRDSRYFRADEIVAEDSRWKFAKSHDEHCTIVLGSRGARCGRRSELL
jgi:hypothetical protein